MKISETFYNAAGALMAPRPLDIIRGSVTPGGVPTTEAGFYHRFKFEGRSESELKTKVTRFFESMNSVRGYSTLVPRQYTVEMDDYVRHGLDVIYVVEAAPAAPARPARPARVKRTWVASAIVTTR